MLSKSAASLHTHKLRGLVPKSAAELSDAFAADMNVLRLGMMELVELIKGTDEREADMNSTKIGPQRDTSKDVNIMERYCLESLKWLNGYLA